MYYSSANRLSPPAGSTPQREKPSDLEETTTFSCGNGRKTVSTDGNEHGWPESTCLPEISLYRSSEVETVMGLVRIKNDAESTEIDSLPSSSREQSQNGEGRRC